jgi:hypothetical protein
VNTYHAYSFNYLEVRDVHNAGKSTKPKFMIHDDDDRDNDDSMAVYNMGALSPTIFGVSPVVKTNIHKHKQTSVKNFNM